MSSSSSQPSATATSFHLHNSQPSSSSSTWYTPLKRFSSDLTIMYSHQKRSPDRPRTLAKQRSRSLTGYKPERDNRFGSRSPDSDSSQGRRSRSASSVVGRGRGGNISLNLRSVPKKRDMRGGNAASPGRKVSSRRSKVYPSSGGVFGGGRGKILETIPSVEEIDVTIEEPRQEQFLFIYDPQTLYTLSHNKLLNPRRPPHTRIPIHNLIKTLIHLHPTLTSTQNQSTTEPTEPDSSTSTTTSAPWNVDDSPPNTFGDTLTPRRLSPTASARRANRKRLAKLASGTPLSPGPSPLRNELHDFPTLSFDRKEIETVVSAAAAKAMEKVYGTRTSYIHITTGRDESDKRRSVVRSVSVSKKGGMTTLKKVWKVVKKVVTLDESGRKKRRERDFWIAGTSVDVVEKATRSLDVEMVGFRRGMI